jgi:DNA polymerase-3 subunit gamma/tau
MLSGHSFNALLKTLEEPPPHVKFLLATTDPHKIPVTVLSRCLQLNLKRLLPSEIFTQMGFILTQEKIEFESDALKLLSRAADGSMRDGLSLLDQAIVFGNGRVNNDDVHAMLGSIAKQPVEAILYALAKADAPAILDHIDELSQLSPDFTDLLQQLLQFLHRIALVQHVPTTLTHDLDVDVVAELAKQLSPEDVQLYYQIGLLGQKELDLSPDPRSGFEMVMLRMLTFRPAKISAPANIPPAANAIAIASAVTEQIPSPPTIAPTLQPPSSPPQLIAPQETAVHPVAMHPQNWESMVANLKSGMTKQFASRCVLEHLDDIQCKLSLDPEFQSLLDDDSMDKLEKSLRELLAKPIKLSIEVKTLGAHTPAQLITQAQDNRQQEAVQAIYEDRSIIYFQDNFDAHVLPETIQPL